MSWGGHDNHVINIATTIAKKKKTTTKIPAICEDGGAEEKSSKQHLKTTARNF